VDLSGAAWRKSSYSGGNGGQCVELAATSRQNGAEPICAVRDSKDPHGPVLAFGQRQWQQFTANVKVGKFGLA
jgi:hypothetical protein